MVFKEQDVVAPHNTSSQRVQQKDSEHLFSSSIYVLFTAVSRVSGQLQRE